MKLSLKPLIKRAKALATLNNAVLVVALLIASTWVWSTIEAIQHNFKLQQKVDALSQQIAVDELQNKTLELQRSYYSSDQYLELSARERLGLAMPGEKVLVLPANTVRPVEQTQAVVAEATIADRSNFAQWMYFLFGKKDQKQ